MSIKHKTIRIGKREASRTVGHSVHESRLYDALIDLTRRSIWQQAGEADMLRNIAETLAQALDVERVSVWDFNPSRDAIVARHLFIRTRGGHSSGDTLRRDQYPSYFSALEQSDVIAAGDAREDARTCEFWESYLNPNGITSMLDAPIVAEGRVAGVLCLEHTGPPRQWTSAEQSFAVSSANLLSIHAAQAARIQSERHLQAVVENEPECVKLVSLDGHLLEMNPAGLRMIEADRLADVAGMPIRRVIHPDDHEAYFALHQQACTGEGGRAQFRVIGLKGAERWMETSSTPLRDASGLITSVLSVTRDISDRRKAEAALQESQRMLMTLTNNLPGLAYRCHNDEHWTAEFISKGAWDLTGYHPHELYPGGQTTYGELIHPDDRDRVWQWVQKAIDAQQPFEVEYRIRTADRQEKWVWERGQAVEESDTGQVLLEGFITDISEQRRASDTILRVAQAVSAASGESLFKELTQRMVEALDATGGVIALMERENPAKVSTQAFILRGELVEDVCYAVANTPCERVSRGEDAVFKRAVTNHFPDDTMLLEIGAEAYVGVPLRSKEGKVIGVVAVIYDHPVHYPDLILSSLRIIAARMASELDRHTADARIREQASMLDKARDAILVRDMDGRITYWNKSAALLYGWSAEEAVGQIARDLLYRDPTLYDHATERVMQDGEWTGELQHHSKSGEPLIIEGRWTLVRDEQGNPRAILAINADLTERRKMEKQLLRTQRMESIGALAGGLAHDLNNVLTPVLMSAELLKAGEHDPERLNALELIESSARHGADLLKQILSFAKGEKGARMPVRIRQLLRDIERIINETFFKQIEVDMRLQDDALSVSADPTQLHQVLLNLCLNARDAMPDGGRLNLTAERTEVSDRQGSLEAHVRPGPFVAIHVEDTGKGMAQEVMDRLFEPFFTTKQPGKGTGLGLPSAYAIVKAHGGFMRIYSEPGKGSRFSVYLPALIEKDVEIERGALEEPPRGNDERVLVIDDEEALRKILRLTLETHGYQVLEAEGGQEALDIIEREQDEIDLVITDMMMPVMDGPATLRSLRTTNPTLPVIAVSGLSMRDRLKEVPNSESIQFLLKPYSVSEFLRIVRKALKPHGGDTH